MTATKVPLKNAAVAGILAFLVPGLGHFYQGRTFKGLLYATCILGLFGWGMAIGEGKVVYFHWNSSENRTYAYLCQFWTGLPAIPALTQSRRPREAFALNHVRGKITEHFSGMIELSGSTFPVSGSIEIRTPRDDAPYYWEGEFNGTAERPDGPLKVEGHLTGNHLDPLVAPGRKRRLAALLEGKSDSNPPESVNARIAGFIPRSLWNSYEAPLLDQRMSGDATDLDLAHRELGSRFELGVVYTMIAGLLNILAIYDALEGPAYGDDEEEDSADDKKDPEAKVAA